MTKIKNSGQNLIQCGSLSNLGWGSFDLKKFENHWTSLPSGSVRLAVYMLHKIFFVDVICIHLTDWNTNIAQAGVLS